MLRTSVVISTFNRTEGILLLLKSIEKQTVLPYCVIIVDQGKTNKTEKAVADFRAKSDLNCFHLKVSFQGLTKARNFGLAQVETELVTFLDDDVEVGPDYIEKIVDAFRASEVILLGGIPQFTGQSQKGSPKPSWFWIFYRRVFNLTRPSNAWKVLPNFEVTFESALRERTKVEYISGSNFTVFTRMARLVGFDEKLVWYSIGEDIDFPLRVGKRWGDQIWLDPSLPVYHPMPPSVPLSEFLLMVHSCHHYYLFHKHWVNRRHLSAIFQFIRSRIGQLFLPSLQVRRYRILPNLDLLCRSVRVEFKVITHLKGVFQGTFPLSF